MIYFLKNSDINYNYKLILGPVFYSDMVCNGQKYKIDKITFRSLFYLVLDEKEILSHSRILRSWIPHTIGYLVSHTCYNHFLDQMYDFRILTCNNVTEIMFSHVYLKVRNM